MTPPAKPHTRPYFTPVARLFGFTNQAYTAAKARAPMSVTTAIRPIFMSACALNRFGRVA